MARQTVTSIDLTNLDDKIFSKQLVRSEQALLAKLMQKFKMTSHGHDLTDAKDYSNQYFAQILNVSQETARKAKEKLHARGIILIDGQTWDQYQKEGRRRKTGHRQTIQLTPEFKNFVVSGLQGLVKWTFNYCELFKKKLEDLKHRAQGAYQRWFDRQSGKLVPLLGKGSPKIGTKFVDGFNEMMNKLSLTRLIEVQEIPPQKELSIVNWLKQSGDLNHCLKMLLDQGYARTFDEAKEKMKLIVDRYNKNEWAPPKTCCTSGMNKARQRQGLSNQPKILKIY